MTWKEPKDQGSVWYLTQTKDITTKSQSKKKPQPKFVFDQKTPPSLCWAACTKTSKLIRKPLNHQNIISQEVWTVNFKNDADFFSQSDLDNLVRDLKLYKKQAALFGSRLRKRNARLSTDTKISSFQQRVDEVNGFSKAGD